MNDVFCVQCAAVGRVLRQRAKCFVQQILWSKTFTEGKRPHMFMLKKQRYVLLATLTDPHLNKTDVGQ